MSLVSFHFRRRRRRRRRRFNVAEASPPGNKSETKKSLFHSKSELRDKGVK